MLLSISKPSFLTNFFYFFRIHCNVFFPALDTLFVSKKANHLLFWLFFDRSPPTALMELINSSCAHMTEMVHEVHVPFGEHLDMTGDTEAQIVSLALMLAWKVLLQFFRSLPQEKRVEYAKYIKQNKMVDSLLCVLFRLIPVKSTVVVVETDDSEPGISRLVGQRTIQQLACGLFYSLLQWMPAIVRQWWNSVDKRQSAIVDK